MKKRIITLLVLTIGINCIAQTDTSLAKNERKKVYFINKPVDYSITAGGIVANFFGVRRVLDKPRLTEAELMTLNPDDIPRIDRYALDFTAEQARDADALSDVIFQSGFVVPAILLFDDEIRKDGWDIGLMYLEAHAVAGVLYAWGAAGNIDRYRPVVYKTNEPLEERLRSGTRSSFYSGHTANLAVSTFFMAKVYSDYHPELGNKKYLLYGAAALPPMFMGYLRTRAGEHFLTDTFVGMLVGSSVGILVPHFHKNKSTDGSGFSLLPYQNSESAGFVLNVRF